MKYRFLSLNFNASKFHISGLIFSFVKKFHLIILYFII